MKKKISYLRLSTFIVKKIIDEKKMYGEILIYGRCVYTLTLWYAMAQKEKKLADV